MVWFKITIAFSILLFVGIYGFLFLQTTEQLSNEFNPEPTIQYSNPIGPTQEHPYQLKSESLLGGKE